ncbi:MAG: OmpA family protein [Polyangiaceae bacterium]
MTSWALCLALATPALADGPGFAVDRFDPAERGSDWFANNSLDLRGDLRPAVGVTYDWGYKSLVIPDSAGRETVVLRDQMFVHTGGALILRDRLRLGVSLPVLLHEGGDELVLANGGPALGSPGIGDARVSSDLRLFGEFGGPATGALGVRAYFPTGDQARLTSDGTLRLLADATVAGYIEGFVYSVHAGFHVRPLDGEQLGRTPGSELVFGLATGVKVNDMFVLGPELTGSTAVVGADAFTARSTPLELLFGFHVTLSDHWRMGSAIGPGLTPGDGAAVMRVLACLEFAPDYCVDKDGDGICKSQDACPDVDGVPTGDPKTNGCLLDRDRDGFADKDDACPDKAGVKSGDPKTTGCPDRDHDGVPDESDACPDEAGVSSKDAKTTGCQEAVAKASIEGPQVQTSEPIAFLRGTAELDPATTPLLEAVVALLTTESKVIVAVDAQVVSVPAPERSALAEKRALAVQAWLVAHGIAASRVRVSPIQREPSQSEQPTEDRVELRVVEQEEPVTPLLD